jgi:hypothetical protein
LSARWRSPPEYQASLNRIRNVSNSEDEVAFAASLANKVTGAYPYMTRSATMKDYVELRSLSTSDKPGEAINRGAQERNLMLLARTRTALASSGYSLDDGETKALAQAIEGSGRAMDPNAQFKMFESYVRAKQVFGNAIQAHMIRDYVQSAKSSNFSLADGSFFETVFARLAQGNASRLGNEYAQTQNTLVGGHMTKAGAQWLVKTGLIQQNQIRKGGGGKFFIAGKVKDQDLLSTFPELWAMKDLLPGIEKTGATSHDKVEARMKMMREQELKANPNAKIDDRALEERALHGLVADYLSKSGFRTTVTDNLAHLIANSILTQRDVLQMRGSKGLNAAETIGKNPVASFQELTNSVTALVETAGSPAAAAAGETMHKMAGWIADLSSSIADWQEKHPEATKTMGKEAADLAMGNIPGLGLLFQGKAAWDYFTRAPANPASAGPPGSLLPGGASPETLRLLAEHDAEGRSYGSGLNLTGDAWPRGPGYMPTPGGGFGTGLPNGDLDLGPKIRGALEGLKATVVDPIKVDPVELKGAADVRISVSVDGDVA